MSAQQVARLRELLARVQRNKDLPRPTRAAAPAPPAEAEDELIVVGEADEPDVDLDDEVLAAADAGDVDDLLDLDGNDPDATATQPRAAMETYTGEEVFDDDDIVELDEDDSFEILEEDDDGEDLVVEDSDEGLDDLDEPAAVSQVQASSGSSQDDVDVEFDLTGDDSELTSEQRLRAASPATSTEDAMAELGSELEEEPSAPMTPPPESGRQVSSAPLSQPVGEMTFDAPEPSADVLELETSGEVGTEIDDLLGADPVAPPADKPRPPMPTMEQLGETVELEPATDAELELQAQPELEVAEPKVAPAPAEDLEMDLPTGAGASAFDASLSPPPEAKDELAAYKLREAGQSTPPAAVPIPAPTAKEPAAPVAPTPAATPSVVEAVVTRRPAVDDVQVLKLEGAIEPFEPKTFVALLDASLKL